MLSDCMATSHVTGQTRATSVQRLACGQQQTGIEFPVSRNVYRIAALRRQSWANRSNCLRQQPLARHSINQD